MFNTAANMSFSNNSPSDRHSSNTNKPQLTTHVYIHVMIQRDGVDAVNMEMPDEESKAPVIALVAFPPSMIRYFWLFVE